MPGIEPLLKMIAAQGGNEMRLIGGERPQLFHDGNELRFFLPPMSDGTLQALFEPLADALEWERMLSGEQLDIEKAHGKYGRYQVQFGRPEGRFEALIRKLSEVEKSAAPQASAAPPAVSTAPRIVEARPEPKVELRALLLEALDRGASDLHLAEGEPATLRCEGRLITVGEALDVAELMEGVLDEAGRARLAGGTSVDLALELPGRARLRGNIYRQAGGLAAAFRVLSKQAPELDTLNLPMDLRPLVDEPHGLIIVCGPTGSGKSTTLAAMAQHALRSRGGLLVSLEEPIEYTFAAPKGALVRQREIGTHVRSFQTGLKDALREDPDLLLVGEMRDRETIELALTAAETGHLVLTTLHSRSAASAVDRIVDAYPAERQAQIRLQLADALRAIIAQRLLPKRGGGRVPALEVLRDSSGVLALIREGRTANLPSALQTGGAEGMMQLERCLAGLVREGLVAPQDAEAAANDRGALRDYLS